MKKGYWLAEWGDVSFIFHAFSRKEVWKKLHFHIIHFSAFPLSDGSKLAALFQVCEKRIPRGTFSYKFSWKTYLKNFQFIYLNYLRKMVIFHSYVSLPEGYRVMFCQFFPMAYGWAHRFRPPAAHASFDTWRVRSIKTGASPSINGGAVNGTVMGLKIDHFLVGGNPSHYP